MKKLLSLTLALATLSATCYAEQPKAADYRNIMSSGNYYVEYEYNYAKKILAVQNGKRMDYTMLQSQPNTALAALRKMMHEHIDYTGRELYRLFFYDCKPLDEKRHLPISKRCLDYSTTPQCIFRKQLHNELKKQRKCALRLGYILDSKDNRWIMKGSVLHDLLNKKRRFEELTDGDFTANIRQKQVDMMIGVDIATLCLKELVDTIVLVSGDGDFVPASKLARREGIDFILDPMHMESQIHEALFEHIDAIHNALQNRSNRKTSFRNTESMQKT